MPSHVPSLIFIDGLPGSGKSTAAEAICARAMRHGLNANLLLETMTGHPLHPLPLDELGAVWADIHLRMTAEEFAEASISRWKAYLGAESEGVRVVESFPFQSSIRVLLQMDASPSLIDDYWQSWQLLLAPTDTVTVFLKEDDAEKLLQHAIDARSEEWCRYMCQSFEKMLYAEVRGWQGLDAVYRFIADYSLLIDRLLQTLSLPVLIFEARPANYSLREQQIAASLGL